MWLSVPMPLSRAAPGTGRGAHHSRAQVARPRRPNVRWPRSGGCSGDSPGNLLSPAQEAAREGARRGACHALRGCLNVFGISDETAP